MNIQFYNRDEIIVELVNNWGYSKASFYNTPTNSSVEKFWTFNRLYKHLVKLQDEYLYDRKTGMRLHIQTYKQS